MKTPSSTGQERIRRESETGAALRFQITQNMGQGGGQNKAGQRTVRPEAGGGARGPGGCPLLCAFHAWAGGELKAEPGQGGTPGRGGARGFPDTSSHTPSTPHSPLGGCAALTDASPVLCVLARGRVERGINEKQDAADNPWSPLCASHCATTLRGGARMSTILQVGN